MSDVISPRSKFLAELNNAAMKISERATVFTDPELDENEDSAYPETAAFWNSSDKDSRDYFACYDKLVSSYRSAIEEATRSESVDKEDHFTAEGVIAKTDLDKRLVFGWAYVAIDTGGAVVVDKSGDFIDTLDELEDAAYGFVLRSRNGDAYHSSVKTSEMVESVVFTPSKLEKMGIPAGTVRLGWWVGMKVLDDSVWERVKSGELSSFSISGTGVRRPI